MRNFRGNSVHLRFFYLAIFLLAFFFRSYHLYELFPFTMDEEYQGFLVAKTLAGDLPLIGVNVADTGLYLGPYFTWFTAAAYGLAQVAGWGYAETTAWMAALIGSLTAVFFAGVVKRLVATQTHEAKSWHAWIALIAGMLYAVNPLINLYDRKYWNPSMVMVLTVVWLWSMNLCFSKPPTSKNTYRRALIGFALVFGLALHTHYSLWVLLPTTLVAWGWRWWREFLESGDKRQEQEYSVQNQEQRTKELERSVLSKHGLFAGMTKGRLVGIGILLVCLLPLVVFELRHDFVMTKGVYQRVVERQRQDPTVNQGTLQTVQQKVSVLPQSLDRLLWLGWNADMAQELINCKYLIKSHPAWPLSLLFLGAGVWLWKRKIFQPQVGWVGGVLLTTIVGVLVFPSQITEYYLLPLFPLAILLLVMLFGVMITTSSRLWHLAGIGTLGLTLISWGTQSLSMTNALGLAKKQAVLAHIKKSVTNTPYHLEVIGQCYAYEGYRFLAEVEGIAPVSSYMDAALGWLYPNELSTPSATVIVGYEPDLEGATLKRWQTYQQLASQTFQVGQFRGVVLPPKTSDY